jgi:hypothetical protein
LKGCQFLLATFFFEKKQTFLQVKCSVDNDHLKFTEMGENFILHEATNDNNRSNKTSTGKAYTTDVAKNYIDQRKEKAAKQSQNEKNGVSNAKLSEQKWDEMKSYHYAIF